MATAAFLDKYFECVDSLPLDLQRYVSRLREVELEKKELFVETERVKEELVKAVQSGSKKQCNLFRRLQECLLLVREVGNTKLEISARMLDKVEDYSQQLSLCSKDLELHPHSDDILLTPRGPGGSLHYHQHNAGESPMTNGIGEHKSTAKRSAGVKRPRQHTVSVSERDEEGSGQFVANGGGGAGGSGGGKEGGANGSKSKEGVTGGMTGGGANTGSVAGTGTGNGKPPKKKVKTIKKKVGVSKDKDSSSSAPAHVPMPDLTSQPLDPNEPTYCLCQQVSFGEMIGCDNDDCPIEWFHFQCVGLTSKPKGKWYCPSCLQERKSKSGK